MENKDKKTTILDFTRWLYKDVIVGGGYESNDYDKYRYVKTKEFHYDSIGRTELNKAGIKFIAEVTRNYLHIYIVSPLLMEEKSDYRVKIKEFSNSKEQILEWFFIDGLRLCVNTLNDHILINNILNHPAKTIKEFEDLNYFGGNFFRKIYVDNDKITIFKLVITTHTSMSRVGKDNSFTESSIIRYVPLIRGFPHQLIQDSYIEGLLPESKNIINSDYAYAPSHSPRYNYSISFDDAANKDFYKKYNEGKHYEYVLMETNRAIKENDNKDLIDLLNSKK